MKRTIKFLALVSAFAIGLSTTATVAFAAIRKTEVPLYSNSGVFNEVDWTYKGDTASTTFKSKIKGDVAELNPVAWGAGWLCPWKPVKITADAPATLEFDILEMSNFAMRPWFGAGMQQTFADLAITPGTGFEIINAADFKNAVDNGTGGYYNDRECTEPASGDSAQAGYNCWIGLLPTTEKVPNGYRLKFEIYSDGVLYASRTNLNADGTLSDVCEDVYAKGFFPQVTTDTEYWFGMNYWNDAPVIIDNFNVYGGGTDACRVNFTGTAWRDSDGSGANTDKVFSKTEFLTQKNISEIAVSDFVSGDRIVTEEKIKADSVLNQVLSVKMSVNVSKLNKKVGVAFGLANQTAEIGTDGVSYVYFENKTENEQTLTYVNVNNNGTEGTPVSLGLNLETAGMTTFEITVNKDGAKLALGKNVYELNVANYNGYVAVAAYGGGNASLVIKSDLTLTVYKYRGSDGGVAQSNFNTGYINPENFTANSIAATQFVDPEQARGIVAEDGKLRFAGTGDGAYFKTSVNYSDYIVEFKLTEYNDAEKPALVDSWTYGYAMPVVILGVKEGSGWAKGAMVELKNGVVVENFIGGTSYAKGEVDYSFRPDGERHAKTTAMKIVAVEGVVKVYAFEITETTELKKDNYVLLGTFEVPELYGAISFAATEAGYFDIDDLKVVPVDDPDAEKMAQNIENFVDFAEIADEYRPVKLDAPEVAVNGNVIAWTEVEKAAGYIVNVNGKLYEVGADVRSFVVEGEAGEYTVTVIAKGNGDYISDSEQSEPVIAVIEDKSNSSSGSGSSGSIEESTGEGCTGSVASMGLLTVLCACATVTLRKIKEKR